MQSSLSHMLSMLRGVDQSERAGFAMASIIFNAALTVHAGLHVKVAPSGWVRAVQSAGVALGDRWLAAALPLYAPRSFLL